MVDSNILKENVGKKASELISDGQVVGLGTGSTTHHFIRYLGKRVQDEGLDIIGIPTSFQSLILAKESGIKTSTINEYDVDIAVDGADEVDHELNLIKGGGAAHTIEKLIDYSANEFVVIVDESKIVDNLGSFPVPVEIIPDSLKEVEKRIIKMGAKPEIRMGIKKDGPVITDNGNFVLDCNFEQIINPKDLELKLNAIPGVLENGIFYNVVDKVIIGTQSGIEEINK